jgi:hypothetical protein
LLHAPGHTSAPASVHANVGPNVASKIVWPTTSTRARQKSLSSAPKQ